MVTEKKLKVIYVDDDPFLRDMYAAKFSGLGHEFKAYSNGIDFLKDVKDNKMTADVVLLDIIMPNMDGIAILGKIRDEKLLPDTAIVMLTNQSGSKEIEDAKKLGVAGYIVKANNIPSEVVEKVQDIWAEFKK
jgi:CheY-like chemotaxis protein